MLSDFCSAMRCMPVWNGQTLTFVQDRRRIRCGPITNSDVVMPDDNGAPFRYSFSALKDRHTPVEVNYIDPQNGWQTSTELVKTRKPYCPLRTQCHEDGCLWLYQPRSGPPRRTVAD